MYFTTICKWKIIRTTEKCFSNLTNDMYIIVIASAIQKQWSFEVAENCWKVLMSAIFNFKASHCVLETVLSEGFVILGTEWNVS